MQSNRRHLCLANGAARLHELSSTRPPVPALRCKYDVVSCVGLSMPYDRADMLYLVLTAYACKMIMGEA